LSRLQPLPSALAIVPAQTQRRTYSYRIRDEGLRVDMQLIEGPNYKTARRTDEPTDRSQYY
jgi:hypothetical protein